MATRNISKSPEAGAADFKRSGFKVYPISGRSNPRQPHGRRDFYKIVLVTGNMTIRYGDEIIHLNDTFLFFANPQVPHTVEDHSDDKRGYACLFTEAFISGRERIKILKNSPLFRVDGMPIVRLTSEQAAFMTGIFQKMLAVHRDGDDYRDELLRSCIALIIHEAFSIQPQNKEPQKNAATRITHLFMELLEKQFPIESTTAPLPLRTAQDFAQSLSVHVNYLNRSVKEVTGKPTSVHIAERIATEAKALLQYTDWSVGDIAYSLGFEYPTYFNNYFKRVTGLVPKSFRMKKV